MLAKEKMMVSNFNMLYKKFCLLVLYYGYFTFQNLIYGFMGCYAYIACD